MGSESPLEVANETANNTPEAAVENTAAKPSSGFDALERKQELQGTVKRIELQGAIVDVGLERDGLLHISQISSETVKNVADVLKIGDPVTVYVLAVDKKKGRLDLTMVKPPGMTWDELKVNQACKGTVVRIEKFGVFVDVGAERPGLIHVSELSSDYVADPAQKFKIGDTVEAKLIGVNRRKKQIDLSIKALEQDQIKEIERDNVMEEEEEDDSLTAMAVALRRAMQESGESLPMPSTSQKKRGGKKRRTSEQEDIISRTLKMHGKG